MIKEKLHMPYELQTPKMNTGDQNGGEEPTPHVAEKKKKTTKSKNGKTLSMEVLQQYFSGSLKYAARSLLVSGNMLLFLVSVSDNYRKCGNIQGIDVVDYSLLVGVNEKHELPIYIGNIYRALMWWIIPCSWELMRNKNWSYELLIL